MLLVSVSVKLFNRELNAWDETASLLAGIRVRKAGLKLSGFSVCFITLECPTSGECLWTNGRSCDLKTSILLGVMLCIHEAPLIFCCSCFLVAETKS